MTENIATQKCRLLYTLILVEKLLPFKSLYLLVNASFRRRHVFFVGLLNTGNCPDRLGWVTARLTTAITCDTDR